MRQKNVEHLGMPIKGDLLVIRMTPTRLFAYTLFLAGLVLLGYVALQAFLLSNGTLEPLRLEWDKLTNERQAFFGLILQIAVYSLLIVAASILLKTSIDVARKL